MQGGIKRTPTRTSWTWIGAFFLLLNISQATAGTECTAPAAHLVSVEGSVERRYETAQGWQLISQGDAVCVGDFIHTKRYSRAGILVDGADTLIRLDENTTFQLVLPEQEPRTLIELLEGAAHFISRVRHSLEVRTPFVSSYIDGTEFLVQVGAAQTTVVLYEGDVLASNDAGSQRILPGQMVTASKGQAPRLGTVVRPRDAVQWTLHYPHIFSTIGSGKSRPMEMQFAKAYGLAQQALQQGDTQTAFQHLDDVPHAKGFALYHVYRAGLLLVVGRVGEAEAELERAHELEAGNSAISALRSLVALSRDDKAQALELANRAVGQDADAVVARIALSYAQQAHFDLEAALASSRKAVALAPEDAYAQARLAELLLSTGDLKGAVNAAQRSVDLNAGLSLGQSMLGFAHLTRIELEPARAAFQQAASLDQSDPMPHLGLGLALIRGGELEQGRRELEVATLLDPQNALVRSYMGKAYYEERRDKVAASQYELAKQQDPNDPTPWFYESILKQQQGQPVEALHSLQTSKALNDNRGVYRSRLMLDGDEAARSASLGQVYRDLSFEQLALVEGWNSLAADPSEHAGHRLLADTYAHLPRHEVARVSELLQAQLLQPVNSTPIQPILAESSLYVPDGVGPSVPAFNEYASLFHRDGVTGRVSAVLGSDDMAGEEVLLSGVKGNLSFSLGQYHFETDGWWDNNDLDQDIYLGFLQANLSDKTSVQLEARRSRKKYGDLPMHFYDGQYLPQERNSEDFDSLRFGFHHRFNPDSELIGSVIFGEKNISAYNEDTAVTPPATLATFEGDWDEDSWSTEIRQLLRWKSVRATAGFGYLENEVDENTLFTLNLSLPIILPPPAPPIPIGYIDVTNQTPGASVDKERHGNGYVYASIDLNPTMTLDLGASYDDYSYLGYERKLVNPKLGLKWQLGPSTTLRAAGFRTLKRPLINNQTIEPTQVAGFNQFFDGINGEQAERYGVALDHRFSEMLFSGVELTHRRRKYPIRDDTIWTRDMGKEEQARAYLYLTPNQRTAMSLEYFYERFHNVGTIDTTHRFPLSLSYFHPSGLNGSIRPTFVRQYGQFDTDTGNDSENFWNVDLSLGYRLPKRRGQVVLDVRNLLDEEFGFQQNDENLPLFMGDRTISLRISLDL